MGNIEDAKDLAVHWDKLLGARVRGYRQALGWTQGELAERMTSGGLPMHQSTITKMEGGSRPTSVGEAGAIAGLFGISLAQLFEPDDQVAAKNEFARLSSRVERLRAQQQAVDERKAQVDAELKAASAELAAKFEEVAEEVVVPPLTADELAALSDEGQV